MGSCGCSSGGRFFKIRNGGEWIVVELIDGCRDCGTPAGIQIGLPSEYECEWLLSEMAELPLSDFGDLGKKCLMQSAPSRYELEAIMRAMADEDVDEFIMQEIAGELWDRQLEKSPQIIAKQPLATHAAGEWEHGGDALDQLVRLRAENERLGAAVKGKDAGLDVAINSCEKCYGNGAYLAEHPDGELWDDCLRCKNARTARALGHGGEGGEN